jgi:hypothetical protein
VTRLRKAGWALALVLAVLVMPPILVGSQLRSFISPWIGVPLRVGDVTIATAHVTQSDWFATGVSVELKGPGVEGSGALIFEHSPWVWLRGTHSWPGFVTAVGKFDVAGAALEQLYADGTPNEALTVTLDVGGAAKILAAMRLPAGRLRVRNIDIPFDRLNVQTKTALLTPTPAVPFAGEFDSVDGGVRFHGQVQRITHHWNVAASIDATLAEQTAASLLVHELAESGANAPEPSTLLSLAARKIDSLVTLGFLTRDGEALLLETAVDETGWSVFGETVEFSFAGAARLKQ